MRPTSWISCLFVYAAVSSAWPWPRSWLPLDDLKREIAPMIERRQNDNNNNNNNNNADSSASPTSNGDGPTSTSARNTGNSDDQDRASITSSSADGEETGDSKTTGKVTDGGGKNGTETEKESKYETTKTFDNRKPAGGLSMITPDIMSGSQYYKIKDHVTFAWNYTSLSITPSAVDVVASCSLNQATYTIAMNESITGNTQAVTWDTGKYQASATIPLAVAEYTLYVYDAAADISATARAGYLAVYNQLTFGMYTPQPYTPISEFQCATCNGAMSSMQRQTLGFMFGMVAVTVLSFGWFAGVAGLW